MAKLDEFGAEHWWALWAMAVEATEIRLMPSAITDLAACGLITIWPPALTDTGRDAVRAFGPTYGTRPDMAARVRREIEIGQWVRRNGGAAWVRFGDFDVGEEIVVADPAYVYDGIDEDLVVRVGTHPGLWAASVQYVDIGAGGIRVGRLRASRVGAWTDSGVDAGTIGVDSGQAGLFVTDRIGGADEAWYDQIMGITCEPPRAGLIDAGLVSSSGVGDGGYGVYVDTQDGPASAVSVVFINR